MSHTSAARSSAGQCRPAFTTPPRPARASAHRASHVAPLRERAAGARSSSSLCFCARNEMALLRCRPRLPLHALGDAGSAARCERTIPASPPPAPRASAPLARRRERERVLRNLLITLTVFRAGGASPRARSRRPGARRKIPSAAAGGDARASSRRYWGRTGGNGRGRQVRRGVPRGRRNRTQALGLAWTA